MSKASTLDLIGQLCDLHLGPAPRAFRVQPSLSQTEAKQKLKIKAYNALFSYLNNRPVKDDSSDTELDKGVESILLTIYRLRAERKYDEADRLESLFSQLRKDTTTDSQACLRFLIALKGSDVTTNTLELGQNIFQYPKPVERKKKLEVLPAIPPNYGDVRVHFGSQYFYMHYPRELFGKLSCDITKADEKHVQNAFDLLPGKGIGPDCLFTTKFLLGDVYEQTTHSSMFGSLMQGRVNNLETHLELPELPSACDIKIPEFQCRKSPSSSQLSEESGLGSGSASMSSSVITMYDQAGHDDSVLGKGSGYDDSVWEKALTAPRSNHYTWEWIGYPPGPTERPHLTEAGPGVYDLLINLRRRVSAIVCPDVTPLQLTTVQPHILVKHLLLMFIGVPSKIFPFNEATQSFGIMEGLHVSGASPEMLASFLTEFTHCGTFYSRLSNFSKPPVLNSFYTGGLVFQGFTTAIRKVLRHYAASVLNIPKDLRLLQLKVVMLKAMNQLRYLAKLCRCHDSPPPKVLPGDFPTGMKLLSYLYDEAEVSTSSSHYPLLLSILQTTFAPFMMFIRDWVFHGVHRDYFEEFMIQADISCQESRDENYWCQAYTLMSGQQGEDGVPQFLRDIVQDVVTCGKSINLLRICHRQHFMCNISVSDIPTVTITFSQEDLKAMEKYCQMYVARMRQKARQISDDRQEFLRKIEQQKLELQHTAKQMADQEIARLQGIIDERKKKANEKKRKEFDRLKKQMESDLKRRADEREEEKEEDRHFVARMNKEEEALTEQEIELEKKARDDLIAYYTELGEEAMHRERLALWRVRRAKLSNARVKFLEADAERWRQELKEQREAKDVLDSGSASNLPGWVERLADQNTPVEVSGQEEVTLPSWAQKEPHDNDSPNIADAEETGVTLPKWAVRGNEDKNAPTVEVTDDQEENIKEEEEDDDVDKGIDGVESDTETDNQTLKSSRHYHAIQVGGASLPKPHVKTVSDAHSTKETEEVPSKPHIHKVEGKGATEESGEAADSKPHLRMVQGVNALTESQESKQVIHIKTSSTMSATKESDPDSVKEKPHLKFREGVQVNEECSEERQVIPKRHRDKNSQTVSSETESQVWVIKKPSLFGHVSQLSNSDYVLTVPKLRRQNLQHANMESNFKDFGIKPRIRMSKTMSASKESDPSSVPVRPRTHIRVLAHRNASVESQLVDENALLIQKFRARNVRGHSSDSTVQKLLYGDLQPVKEDETDGPLERIDLKPGLPYQLEQYETEFQEFDGELCVDMMSNIFVADLGRDLIDTMVMSEEEVEAYKYTPLSVLLTRSVTAPIRAQISLVNSAVINYFTNELRVDDHFEAIRRYLLMADGDFAEILANILLEKLSTNPLPQEILNPVFLNGALNKAIRSSMHSDDENNKNLSFATKYMPSVLMPNAPNSLKCLELRYTVNWPLNVILTSSCMEKYYLVFNFLLQIKRVVWTLKDVWHRLKRDALINRVGNSAQFRQLQLHRQEMQHFVKMMQGYITNQVIHVSWQEFQTTLSQPIEGLDQLLELHEHYVDSCIARCLLEKKAAKVMKIIQDIFCLILKFRSQLVSSPWQRSSKQGEATHANFANMVNTYKSFHVYSLFLFKVVYRLSQKGYQPHLQELLLQLNFNDYYSEAAN